MTFVKIKLETPWFLTSKKSLIVFGFFPGNFAYFFEQGSDNVSITDCLIFDIYVTGLFRYTGGNVIFKRNNIIEHWLKSEN